MDVKRTPDSRFTDLPDYPFAPRYAEIEGLRLHYLDEGPRDADPILLLHGEPSWSFLYRHMIPRFAGAGHRVVVPDLIGFGRSDKPTSIADYSYERHVGWISAWIEQLALDRLTLVGQDWGSLIGLRVAAAKPDRFKAIVIANGVLPSGGGKPPLAFRLWRAFARWSPWFPIGRIVAAGCRSKLSAEVIAAYDAPFPDASYKAGTRAFPRLVPTEDDDPQALANRDAWKVLERWNKPFLTAFSDGDPIMRGFDHEFQRRVPGATGQPHTTIRNAGHFLQEDQGPELADVVIDWLSSIE